MLLKLLLLFLRSESKRIQIYKLYNVELLVPNYIGVGVFWRVIAEINHDCLYCLGFENVSLSFPLFADIVGFFFCSFRNSLSFLNNSWGFCVKIVCFCCWPDGGQLRIAACETFCLGGDNIELPCVWKSRFLAGLDAIKFFFFFFFWNFLLIGIFLVF